MILWCIKISVDIFWYMAVMTPVLAVLPFPWAQIGYLFPVIYAVLTFFTKHDETLGTQKTFFIWQLRVLLVVTAIEWTILGTTVWSEAVVWMIAFLVSGVFFLRITRLGKDYRRDKLFWAWNAIYLLALLFLALLLTSDTVVFGVGWLLKCIYFYVIVPILQTILSGFGWVIYVVVLIVWKIFDKIGFGFPKEMVSQILFTAEDITEEEVEELREIPFSIQTVFSILCAIAVGIGIYFLYRKLVSVSKNEDENHTGLVKTRLEKPEHADTGRKKRVRQTGIRLIYQKFLGLCEKSGISITPYETSLRVQKRAEDIWKESELQPLRELYLKARYGMQQAEEEDIERAKRQYKKIKEEKVRPKKM